MTMETVQKAQDYLTINNDNRVVTIINIVPLLRKHPTKSVIDLLDTLYKEKQENLENLITRDKTTQKINDTIAAMFRIHMAKKTIENEMEVRAA